MNYLETYKITNSGFLGTLVTLELLFTTEPSTITISVFDSSGSQVVDDANGTKNNPNRYITFSYQSSINNYGGTYHFRVLATFSDGVDYRVIEFDLEDLELE